MLPAVVANGMAGSCQATSKPELLAPAGDRDCLRAAVENGADAVYFGLAQHNARARAANFTIAELPQVMLALHRRGVKGYVTLNTLVFPRELDGLEQMLRQIAEAGTDAIIVQDLGVVRLARALCPELPIHASTQMTLTSAESIRFAEELGVERVILARELSLDEIRHIRRQTRMPLEVFVHGALCVAYSGQCLTSEALGGRSANRGQCAQACRLPYEVVCDGQVRELGDVQHLLSPQDLAAYTVIPELVELGVSGLKIEGRLKTPEYVANITKHYRMALDGAVARNPVVFSRRQVEEMELSFSRGFSTGWLHGNNHKVLVEGRNPRKHGLFVGKVRAVRRGRVLVQLAGPLKRGDGIVFDRGRPEEPEQGGRVYEIFRRNKTIPAVVSTGLVELAFGQGDVDLSQVLPDNCLWKTDDPELTRQLRRTFTGGTARRRVSLDVRVEARAGAPLRVECQAESGIQATVESSQPLAAAIRHPITADLLREQLGRLGNTVYALRSLYADIQGQPMVPLSVLGRLRHEMVRRLDELADGRGRRTVATNSALEALRAAIRDQFSDDVSFPLGGEGQGDGSGWTKPPGVTPHPPGATPHPNPLPQGERELIHSGSRTMDAELIPAQSLRTARHSPITPHRREQPATHDSPLTTHQEAELRVLCRSLDSLRAVIAAGVASVYVDFQDIRQYARAVSIAHAAGREIYLSTPRIQKPAEGPLFRHLLRHGADGILVRNLGGLMFYTERQVPVVADFSLNASNELVVQLLRERGASRVTASYDLNREQLLDLVSAVLPSWLELVIHQHMPMFHMEHCVFCAFLSPGTDRTNCGRPCDRHDVKLRDRVGMEHPLKADVGCRNTLFNAVPQSAAEHVSELLDRGVRNFRVELLDEAPGKLTQVINLYRDLLAGLVSGREVWTRLKATNRVGVTRGPLES